ncbi:MAG TPA: 3-deoxy-8-phosphooctulonate synthase [Candidatus Omnitrophica bacterium]|nr:3-deoxy-8-phosphooctulonate synthase [Candidatus Omnitrophota bacterium]
MKERKIKIADIAAGEKCSLLFILGPCVIEDYESLLDNAKSIKQVAEKEKVNFIFKASYDKANRTSSGSFRGPGLKEGLAMLAQIKKTLGIWVTSDIHSPQEAGPAAAALDMIQIPALLCRQTDIITAAAETKKPVNIKKGQFMAPWDMIKAVEKAYRAGNDNICVTERGSSFGYNCLINDFRSIPRMQEDNLVVIFDATHSVQIPSKGIQSGGESRYVSHLARAAVAAGCDGLFMEAHTKPEHALSDSKSMIDLKQLAEIINLAKKIKESIVG